MSAGPAEKAQALSTVYQYIANRLESIDQRSSVFMVLVGTLIGYIITKKDIVVGHGVDTLMLIAQNPSVIVGLLSFMCFYAAQSVRIKKERDLISRIIFTKENISDLANEFNSSTSDALFSDIISNQRIVGNILISKGRYYNIGAFLLGITVVLYALRQ